MGGDDEPWNENRPDDDDSTSHSLLLTSSLDKTGGRFPGVADESKTHSPVSHNTSLDNNNTNNFTSSDKNPSSNNPSSKPTLKEMKAYVCNNVHTPFLCSHHDFNNIPTADDSQPPIFRFDTTAGQFNSDNDSHNDSDNDDSDDDFFEASSDDV